MCVCLSVQLPGAPLACCVGAGVCVCVYVSLLVVLSHRDIPLFISLCFLYYPLLLCNRLTEFRGNWDKGSQNQLWACYVAQCPALTALMAFP